MSHFYHFSIEKYLLFERTPPTPLTTAMQGCSYLIIEISLSAFYCVNVYKDRTSIRFESFQLPVKFKYPKSRKLVSVIPPYVLQNLIEIS